VSGAGTVWQPVQNWGFLGQTQIVTGYISEQSTVELCGFAPDYTGSITTTSYLYFDAFGILHYTEQVPQVSRVLVTRVHRA